VRTFRIFLLHPRTPPRTVLLAQCGSKATGGHGAVAEDRGRSAVAGWRRCQRDSFAAPEPRAHTGPL